MLEIDFQHYYENKLVYKLETICKLPTKGSLIHYDVLIIIIVAHLDGEESEQLNNYFSSVFTKEDSSDIPSFSLNLDIIPS